MKRYVMILAGVSLFGALSVVACGDDDDGGTTGGTGGQGGQGGQGGSGAPQPRGADNPPTPGAQIDRMGRPAINTALIGTFDADEDAKNALKDEYNAALPPDWPMFVDEIQKNLAILDGLDATCGNQLAADNNPDDRYAFLAAALADDQLYVNSTVGECGVYLGLEAEALEVVEAGVGKCGGRTLTDDVIDRSYSVLAAGIFTGVDDTITENDVAFLDEFPYLAPPQ